MKTAEVTTKTKWTIDVSHSEITFKVRHLMIAHVKGSFKTFEASIYTEGKDFSTAEIDLWIDVASISTGDSKRDEHLKSNEFFDVKTHKQISITASTMPKQKVHESKELWVELTILGIKKNIKMDVIFGGLAKDPYGKEKAGFSLTGKIKRSDWGLTWNATLETGGMMVSDEVTISADLELINMGEQNTQTENLK